MVECGSRAQGYRGPTAMKLKGLAFERLPVSWSRTVIVTELPERNFHVATTNGAALVSSGDTVTAGAVANGGSNVIRYRMGDCGVTLNPVPWAMVPSALTTPRTMRRFSSPATARYYPVDPRRMSPRTSSFAAGELVPIPTCPAAFAMSTVPNVEFTRPMSAPYAPR